VFCTDPGLGRGPYCADVDICQNGNSIEETIAITRPILKTKPLLLIEPPLELSATALDASPLLSINEAENYTMPGKD
jgi:hypothetical protein